MINLSNSIIHGIINYIDTKAKCRHLKQFTCKGTLRQGRCFSEFLDCRYNGHVGFYLVQLSPLLVWISILYTHKQCVGVVWSFGPRTDKHLPQSPLKGQFFMWQHCLLCLIFLRHYQSPPSVMNVFFHTCPVSMLPMLIPCLFRLLYSKLRKTLFYSKYKTVHTYILIVGSLALLYVSIPKTDTCLFLLYVSFFVSISSNKNN